MWAVRNKTTSIKRPETRAAADEGESNVGDLSRGIPVEQRISRRPQLAMFAGLFVLFVVVVAMVAIFILPINTWRDQENKKFCEQFEGHMRLLARFIESNNEHIPYLLRKAEHIEEYLQQR